MKRPLFASCAVLALTLFAALPVRAAGEACASRVAVKHTGCFTTHHTIR